jgi:hypothetical protein
MNVDALAGHADLTTTQPYMRLGPDAIDSAVALLDHTGDKGSRGDIAEADLTETADSPR